MVLPVEAQVTQRELLCCKMGTNFFILTCRWTMSEGEVLSKTLKIVKKHNTKAGDTVAEIIDKYCQRGVNK